MKWLDKKDELEKLINEGLSYNKIGELYNTSGANIRKTAFKLGISLPKRRKINPKETFNKGTAYKSICAFCGKEFVTSPSHIYKFCSQKCAGEYMKQKKIMDWKSGLISGTSQYTTSKFIRNFLLKKYNNSCQICGWNKMNKFTNKVPLQIHHIDGDSTNNKEENLLLLCPNCHSLTENFGSRNKNAPKEKSKYYGRAKG